MRPTAPYLRPGQRFPDPRNATDDGLVAIGGELTVPRLLEAYRTGIFPWTEDPITWWSPDPRGIFDLESNEIHVPRRLRSAVERHPYRITFDTAFQRVMEACARAPRGPRHQDSIKTPDANETWITPGFLKAYGDLHRAGHAHSIELWSDEALAAGLYGVAIGGLFAGESMFHTQPNASKIALVLLQRHLHARGFILFDIQMLTPVTQMMGAIEISREEYLVRLQRALAVNASFV